MPPKRGGRRLDSLWDNPALPHHTAGTRMPTTIKAADLIESISAALQYIS
ncbi:hypothetical protein [Ramlibacter rhizophilus]|nr:hypothetical protein [Ramlibacter rhizophilus]